MVGVDAFAAVPLASPQSERFGVGAGAAGALRVPMVPWLLGGARISGFFLADGPAPADTRLVDPGLGGMGALTLALRFRPEPFYSPDSVTRDTGLWIEVGAGGGVTGDILRPVFDVGVGWNLEIGPVDLGPAARFMHVLHFDDPIDSRGAFILTVGMEIVLFDARGTPPEEPPAPPSDRDGDGYLDEVDGCPDEPEDFDQWEDEDGCPDPDNDHDGILDEPDQCPNEAEDLDGWEDEDGCPDPDNDHDGFIDSIDECPNEAEVVNGVDDGDGCPDEGLIQMIDDRIVLDELVLFDFNRSRVKHSARPILEAIVELWRQHPEWRRVRVEGHADARGDADWNQRLSEARASRVRDYLVDLGMPVTMIEVVGHGASIPRRTGYGEAAHQANRRVEFVVVARATADEEDAESAQAAPDAGDDDPGAAPPTAAERAEASAAASERPARRRRPRAPREGSQ